MTLTIRVAGMTCQNCVRHVEEALRDLPGVTAVHVDLDAARATIESNGALDAALIKSALDEAGYELK